MATFSEGLAITLALALGLSVLYLVTAGVTKRAARWKAAWVFRGVARRLQLSPGAGELSGTISGIPVRVFAKGLTLFVTVTGVDPGLNLRARNRDEVIDGHLVGDPHFDRLFEVRGEPLATTAILGRRARQRLIDVLHRSTGITARSGVLRFQTPVVDVGARGVVDIVRELVAAVSIMGTPADPRGALLDTAHADPSPNVRRRALRVASENWPDDASVQEANHRALADADLENRVYAARRLGPSEREIVKNIFEAAPAAPPLARAKALVTLVELTEPAEKAQVILLALSDDDLQVRIAALTAAGARGVALESELEEVMIGRLSSAGEDEVTALCEVLRDFGSLRAVSPLLGLGRTFATRAARGIQKRAGIFDPGALSVADPSSAGALSVSADRGAVSLGDGKKR